MKICVTSGGNPWTVLAEPWLKTTVLEHCRPCKADFVLFSVSIKSFHIYFVVECTVQFNYVGLALFVRCPLTFRIVLSFKIGCHCISRILTDLAKRFGKRWLI